MKQAIVLSGGGAKGAYQIGVWKALRKLHISYDIVTGTSVGALNAALMVQNDYLKGLWLWYNMDFKRIFDNKIDADYTTEKGQHTILKTYMHAALDGGMNIGRLEQTVDKILNTRKFYRSKVDMGIVTVKLPSLKPVLLRKNQIDPKQLRDYLIASASCFPAFQKKVIDNVSYIDGGLYDNLPINLAIEMGATHVIAVDLESIGVKKRVKYKDIEITYISPHNDLGSFLVFHKDAARRCMRLGFHDAMKVYQKFDGNIYTFYKNDLQKNFDQYYNIYLQNIKKYLEHTEESSMIDKLIRITVFKYILTYQNESIRYREMNRQIEALAKAFHLDDSQLYSINKVNYMLVEHYNLLEENKQIEKDIEDHKLKLLFHNEYLIKYLCDKMLAKRIIYSKILHLSLLFPNEFLQAIYLKTILQCNKK